MSKNYILSWHDSEKNTARSKAKDNVEYFLKNYADFDVISTGDNKYIKLLNVMFLPLKLLTLKKDGIIIIQYPSSSSKIRKKLVEDAKNILN